jgi:hypothetical protein
VQAAANPSRETSNRIVDCGGRRNGTTTMERHAVQKRTAMRRCCGDQLAVARKPRWCSPLHRPRHLPYVVEPAEHMGLYCCGV